MLRFLGLFNRSGLRQYWPVSVLLGFEIILVVYQALRFAVVDQTLWLVSASAFFTALGRGNLAGTYASTILAHPGVTLEWLWGGAKLVSLLIGGNHLAVTLILLVLAVKLLLIAWSAWLLWPRLNQNVLLASGLIWLSHPLLFGASASWLDQLLGLFLWLTLLLWLSYIRYRRLAVVILAGILVGLAGLTKVAGIFIFPMVMIPTWRHFRERWWWQGLVILGLIGGATFVTLYPAMWVSPWHTLTARATTASGTGVSAAGSNGLMGLLLYPYFIIQDAILTLGLMGLVIQAIRFIRHRSATNVLATQLGLAGATYILCLIIISLLISDQGSGAFSFMNYRYLTPAVLLLTPLPLELASQRFSRWGFWLMVAVIILIQFWQGPIIGAWLGYQPAGF